MRVATRKWGPEEAGGLTGLIGLTHHQVTFQVTYEVRQGANRVNRGLGGGEPGAPIVESSIGTL